MVAGEGGLSKTLAPPVCTSCVLFYFAWRQQKPRNCRQRRESVHCPPPERPERPEREWAEVAVTGPSPHCALHVVREECAENFPRTMPVQSSRSSEPVPKVANVGAKVKLDRLVANRAARTPRSSHPPHVGKARQGYCIAESVMSSRAELGSSEDESMVRLCTWCGSPLPLARSPEVDGTIQCPHCQRRFDLRKARTTLLGGTW